MKFHPAAQIITWCLLVVMLQKMTFMPLLMTTSLVFVSAFVLSQHKFIQLIRRTRWVMFSLLIIYSYTTPGQPILESLGMFSPSREGSMDGVLQLTRLISTLAALAILLDRLDRPQLITGLYTLFAPVQLLGLSRERLAVRLALTLYYAEVAMLRRSDTWQDSLRSLFVPHGESTKHIELPVSRFSLNDVMLMTIALIMLWMVFR